MLLTKISTINYLKFYFPNSKLPVINIQVQLCKFI